MTTDQIVNALVTVTLFEMIAIATCSFPGTAAVTATLAFGLFQTIVMAVIAIGWGRLAAAMPGRVSSS